MDDLRQLDLFVRTVPREPIVSPVGTGHLVHFGNELPVPRPSVRRAAPHLDDQLPETWMGRIVALFEDGRPRTFQAIMMELAQVGAIEAAGTHAERGLWLAVERRLLSHSTAAPVTFQAAHTSTSASPGRSP